jgi:uncharacterized protein YyaL (SSP411 family)
VRGEAADLARAEDLLRFCRSNLRGEGGYCIDRVEDRLAVGKLRRPLVSFALNGRLALAALRLARLTGKEEHRETALEILGSLATAVDKMRPDDAAYAEALLAARGEPLEAVLVGGEEAAREAALRRAALLLPVPGAVVHPAAGGRGRALLSAAGLSAEEIEPGAYLCSGTACAGPVRDPAGLPSAALAARKEAERSSGESTARPSEADGEPEGESGSAEGLGGEPAPPGDGGKES